MSHILGRAGILYLSFKRLPWWNTDCLETVIKGEVWPFKRFA